MPYIIIAGPTASGKSALALQLAESYNSVILNADSMQWYKDLPTLTAQPTETDKILTPHYLYGTLDIHTNGSVARWQKEAVDILKTYSSELVIVVGGSGLYLRSLTHGLSPVIDIPTTIRSDVRELTKNMSADTFRALVLQEDPNLAVNMPPIDQQRLARALEVKRTTGQSIRNFQGNAIPPIDAPIAYIVLLPERTLLCQRINQRASKMISDTLFDEIRGFWDKSPPEDCLLRKSIGLKPMTAYINNELTKDSAIELMQIQTRQYAKRQATWLKGQAPKDAWINPTFNEIMDRIKNKINYVVTQPLA